MMIRHNADEPFPLEPKSVQCVVTSPPYWGQRVYGDNPDELGLEDLLEFVRRLTLQFRNVREVLADDGIAWINIGDTAAGSGGAGGDHDPGNGKDHIARYRQAEPVSVFPFFEEPPMTLLDQDPQPRWKMGRGKLANGQLCLVPHLLAWHLQGDGWIIRRTVIWDKKRDKAEDLNHVRRPRSSHEVILMVTKSMSYQFAPARLEETGDVWHFSPGTERKGHPAVFPNELARRCILPSTEPGQTVLDPFAGSGTVPTVAAMNGRVGIGCDLYADAEKVTQL